MGMGPGLEVSSDRLEKLGIEPATTGLQGEWFIHYTTAAARQYFYQGNTQIVRNTVALVKCLTRDRGVAGSSCIVSLSKTLYPLLSTGTTQEDLSQHY